MNPLEFLVPPVPQARPFPPMSLKAFQAFITYWYAQDQAKQSQFPVPPTAPPIPHPAQPAIKLSKSVKEARQLGCETFSDIVYAVEVKNWLKRVSDILTDLELDVELKLRV